MLLKTKAVCCPTELSPFGQVLDQPLSKCTSCDRARIANTRPWFAYLASFTPTLLVISVFACSMTVAGCARNPSQGSLFPVQHEASAAPVHPSARAYKYSEQRRFAKIHRPDAALLAPQGAPDCEFKGANVEAVDATELARLKI
jgi:predicted small secreted protein